jgi:hypothetical protein
MIADPTRAAVGPSWHVRCRRGAVHTIRPGDKNPFVLGSVVRSAVFRPIYRVRIGAQSRREADKICRSLEAPGGACVVLRSYSREPSGCADCWTSGGLCR